MLPAIKANALYGGGYPLFTALGRPLIAKLAVEYARESRLRHDRPRLHRQGQRPGPDRVDRDRARPRDEDHRAGARLADGPRGGDRLRARARHPGQGRHRGAAVLDRRQPLGALVRGRPDRGPRRAAARRRVPARDAPEEAPDEPQDVVVGFERGCPVALDGERLGLVELLERAGEIGCPPRRRASSTTSRTGSSASRCATSTRCPPPRSSSPRTRSSRSWSGTIHQNNFKPQLDDQWAYLVYAGLWYEPLLADLNAFMDSVNEQVTGEITMRLYKGSARGRWRGSSPNALYDPALAGFGESGGLFSQQASPGFIELWSLQSRMAYRVRNREEETACMLTKGYTVLGWVVWQGSRIAAVAQAASWRARPPVEAGRRARRSRCGRARWPAPSGRRDGRAAATTSSQADAASVAHRAIRGAMRERGAEDRPRGCRGSAQLSASATVYSEAADVRSPISTSTPSTRCSTAPAASTRSPSAPRRSASRRWG